jgi:hypothetical protein
MQQGAGRGDRGTAERPLWPRAPGIWLECCEVHEHSSVYTNPKMISSLTALNPISVYTNGFQIYISSLLCAQLLYTSRRCVMGTSGSNTHLPCPTDLFLPHFPTPLMPPAAHAGAWVRP